MKTIYIQTLSILILILGVLILPATTLASGQVSSTVEINNSTVNGPTLTNNDFYGISVSNIGDLNGDGVEDLAVGAYGDDEGGVSRGAVHIHFMNTDGTVDSTAEINSSTVNGPTLANSDVYGTSVANIGDLNGDGVIDLAVGAIGDDAGGAYRGAVHIHFMNTDGSVASTTEINDLTANGPTLVYADYYGYSVANIGDLNDDGVQDLAVGTLDAGDTENGAVNISFMNTDGSVDSTVEINSSTTNGPTLDAGDYYGSSIANIGDLNGDGVTDLAVGAEFDYGSGVIRGAVHIHFMNTDGSVDSTVEINDSTSNGPTLANGDGYGVSIANIGDLNGDGVQDLAVGAYGDDEGGGASGALHIHFMNTDGSVDSTVEINSSTTNGPTLASGDYYGYSVANIGDLNDDGVQDLSIGAYGDDEGGGGRGAVHIHFMLQPSIAYSGAGFTESSANDGSVTGSIIATLTGDTFQDTDADDVLDETTEVVLANVPDGLTASIALTSSDTVATLTLTGNATSHIDSDDVSDITFTFQDAAFSTDVASNVTNATGPASSGLGADFNDQASIAYSGDGFTESSDNDGSVSGSITATLTGDTFQDTDGDDVIDQPSELNPGPIPSGMSATVNLTESDTVATLTISGNANEHENTHDVSDLLFGFQDGAFTNTTSASDVTNATGPASSNLGIDFNDATSQNTGGGGPVGSLGSSGGASSLPQAITPSAPSTPTTPSTPPITSTPTLTQTYSPGVSNTEVKTLQQFLNNQGFTLATTGPGSPGAETNYFGTLTKTALQSFQCHHNIVCQGTPQTSGFGRLGPKTKAKINELNQTPQTPTSQEAQIQKLQELILELQRQLELLQS